MIHDLKTWPEHFRDVRAGIKTAELRLNDRNNHYTIFSRLHQGRE
ncbi:hypothetical protein J31TS6_47890 [Brevibacillus reuszeri]|nr:DUF3850 domain-containing protein [Brevibacillus reuszeri]GIO08761.1 hypothetical protein J31TS6_47890 [Brevibacillus reuszeri]